MRLMRLPHLIPPTTAASQYKTIPLKMYMTAVRYHPDIFSISCRIVKLKIKIKARNGGLKLNSAPNYRADSGQIQIPAFLIENFHYQFWSQTIVFSQKICHA